MRIKIFYVFFLCIDKKTKSLIYTNNVSILGIAKERK